MNFNQFESGINEAPQYSPERLKAHADKAENLRKGALMELKSLQKFVELKTLGGQQLDNAEDALSYVEESFKAYFDHLKTAP